MLQEVSAAVFDKGPEVRRADAISGVDRADRRLFGSETDQQLMRACLVALALPDQLTEAYRLPPRTL